MEHWISWERQIDTIIIWVAWREESLHWGLCGCEVFCSDPWLQSDCLVHVTGVTLAGSGLDTTETEDGVSPVLLWSWAPGQVLGRLSPQTYCRHKSWHADQHLLVLLVSALLSETQKDLEMEFGCFGETFGCSAPWILPSRKQLTTRNCAPLGGTHCCVDLTKFPDSVSVERQNVCWSTVQLLVDTRLRACKLH